MDPISLREKQISVDPFSLKESAAAAAAAYAPLNLPPPLLLPVKTKYLMSTSLPNSATSSPRLGSFNLRKKKKNRLSNQVQPSPFSVHDPLSCQHSVALTRLDQLRQNHLRRSKSCGEGRATAPSYELDLWFNRRGVDEKHGNNKQLEISSFRDMTESKTDHNGHNNTKIRERVDSYDEKFKCGALCLFLPGFGRGKPVRPRKVDHEFYEKEMSHVISRTVSLEKFECGSWTSSAIIMDGGDHDGGGECANLFFDLPLELIRSGTNDADSPVAAAFVFNGQDRKGVLKTSTSMSRGRRSNEYSPSSTRHVRFSTTSSHAGSYPTSPTSCITPRLRKARDDFNAFLEAQGAS